MEKDKMKTQTDLNPRIVNKEDNQKAGYGGRDLPTDKKSEEE